MYCTRCGREVISGETYCPSCGAKVEENNTSSYASFEPNTYSSSSSNNDINFTWLAALLFCIFLGGLGVHRFFVGKIGTGLLWLFTFGCFGIGILVDFVLLVCQMFTDKSGHKLTYNGK